MSGTMGFFQLSELTHEMENLLQEIRNRKIGVSAEIIDTLLLCVDIIEELIADVVEHGEENERDIQMVINKLKQKKFTDIAAKNLTTETKTVSNDFNEYEERLILQALEQGLKVWKITITLVEDCLLKSARAFLVFKTLETFGEIIKTEPIVQDIEYEQLIVNLHYIYLLNKIKMR